MSRISWKERCLETEKELQRLKEILELVPRAFIKGTLENERILSLDKSHWTVEEQADSYRITQFKRLRGKP